MVTVAGKNEMALDEFNRWVESLRDSFYRVLLEDLSWLLKTPEVYRYDQDGSNAPDYQVVIDVTRFDCRARRGGGFNRLLDGKRHGRQCLEHKA